MKKRASEYPSADDISLISCLRNNSIETAKILISRMPSDSLNRQDNLAGETLLHWALANGRYEIAKLLVEKMDPKDLAIQNKKGDTPLHLAIFWNRPEIAQLLIEKMEPKDLAIQNQGGDTPLQLAISEYHFDIVQSLIEKMDPEDLGFQKAGQGGVLHAVIQNLWKWPKKTVIKLIKRMNPNDLGKMFGGQNPLHQLVSLEKLNEDSDREILEVLLKSMNENDRLAFNANENSALHLAIDNQNIEEIELVAQYIPAKAIEDPYPFVISGGGLNRDRKSVFQLAVETYEIIRNDPFPLHASQLPKYKRICEMFIQNGCTLIVDDPKKMTLQKLCLKALGAPSVSPNSDIAGLLNVTTPDPVNHNTNFPVDDSKGDAV